jgi:Tfp pilus assembly protein PilO
MFIDIILVAIIVLLLLYKLDILKDEDNDFIPDEAEELYDKAKAEAKSRLENVKAEAKGVKDAAKNLAKQTGDVFDAMAGKKRK